MAAQKQKLETKRRTKAAFQSEGEAEAWHLDAKDQALLDSFDGRLEEAHRRMDRVLARLNIE